MNSLEEFAVRSGGGIRLRDSRHCIAPDPPISFTGTGQEMFEAVKNAALRQSDAVPAWQQRGLSEIAVRNAAQADCAADQEHVGLEIAFADVGGWDTHVNQGGATGQLAQRLDDFAKSIAALTADLGDRMQDVVILTMSEFGRMARQNGNGANGSWACPARCS